MKILFLAPHLSTGGMPQFLLKRIESLKKNNNNDIYVVEYECYSLDFTVQRNAIKSLLGENFTTLPSDKMHLLDIVKSINPDIIHIDEMAERLDWDVMKALYGPNRSYRIVETCHDIMFNPEEKIYHPDLYIFCSQYHEDTFANMQSKFITIEYPIDDNKTPLIQHQHAKKILGFNINKKNVINVGLWTPGKNQGQGIEIARQYPDIDFHFIGNQAENFRSYWEPLMEGLPDNVIIWGERSDIRTFMQAADIFMFNSTLECNPIVLREAISYGLPIVANNLPQYVGRYDGYLHPIDTDLNELEIGYSIPADYDSIAFGTKHEEAYDKILKLPIIEQKPKIIHHFIDHPFLEIKGVEYEDKKHTDCVSIVLAHPNTDLRSELLINCLKKLNTPVILSANYPVEKEAQLLCDYVIYTKENPLLFKNEFKKYNVGFCHFKIDIDGKRTTTLFEKEHGYSVYCLIKNGVEYAKKLGYGKVNIINYDYEISKHTIEQNIKELDSNDFVVYKYTSNSYEVDSYCTAFFSAKIDAILSFVEQFKSKDEYYSHGPSFNILEIKFFNFINENKFKLKELLIEDLKIHNKVDVEGIDYTNENEKNRAVEYKRFLVEYYDENDVCIYSNRINLNHWIKLNRQYFTCWRMKVWDGNELIYENKLNLEGKKVYICIESSSLGDTLAWLPYALEFKNKHKCHVVVSTFWNQIFDYPELELVTPGAHVSNIYALYRVGWFYNENKEPEVPNLIPMQKAATNILGLEYKEIKPKLKTKQVNKEKQVAIAIHSTTQAKYWNNPEGWQEVVDHLLSKGYIVKLLSKEGTDYMGNRAPNGVVVHPNGSIESVMEEILKSELFIGIGSGLSWLSWSLGVKTILISGFSEPFAEMKDCIRISTPENKCSGCFNRHRLDAGDWNWCPDHKNTSKQFECTKSITSKMIIDEIKKVV